jgi:hypothetical protein
MEQKAVIWFLTVKALNAKAIQVELESAYGTDACLLMTAKKWRIRFLHGRTDLFDDLRSGRPLTQDLAEAIRFMLAERLFSSCKVLCRHSWIAMVTCLWMLHNNLAFPKFHLAWVPDTLSSNRERE